MANSSIELLKQAIRENSSWDIIATRAAQAGFLREGIISHREVVTRVIASLKMELQINEK